MYKSYEEIFKQGEPLSRTFDEIMNNYSSIHKFFAENDFDEIVFVACGSSYWLSLSACMTLQERIGKRCSAVKSGDIIMNKDFYGKMYSKPLIIAPSRSGSTTETIMAVDFLRKTYNAKVLCMTEKLNSPIVNLSDMVLEFPWVTETSVCQSRSFTNLYMASVLISAILGQDNNIISCVKSYLEDFNHFAAQTEILLQEMSSEILKCKSLVTLGNGKLYGVSIAGAYICIEMAQLQSNYFGTLEYRHGPIVMAEPGNLVFILSGGNARVLEESMAKEIRHRGVKVAVISYQDDFVNADYRFCIGRKAEPEVIALFGALVLQGLAYFKAVLSEIDPDNPKGLVPWISI